jgi:LmbE family N-acetylglucosaminyl deacetylase
VLPATGTLHLTSKAGWNVRCLILTDGNLFSSPIKGTRHREAEAARKVIGATYDFYAFEESNFSTQALIKVLDAILVLSRFWARELGHKDGYFEAF